MLPLPSNTGFAAFSGRGRRLDGKDSGI
jgi:hypothetical protein